MSQHMDHCPPVGSYVLSRLAGGKVQACRVGTPKPEYPNSVRLEGCAVVPPRNLIAAYDTEAEAVEQARLHNEVFDWLRHVARHNIEVKKAEDHLTEQRRSFTKSQEAFTTARAKLDGLLGAPPPSSPVFEPKPCPECGYPMDDKGQCWEAHPEKAVVEGPNCDECGGYLGGKSIFRLEDHKSGCSRMPF